MTSASPSDPGSPAPLGAPVLLWVLLVLTAVPELVLQGADHGLWGAGPWGGRLRGLAYNYGAFWAGLLHGWTPNYAAQPYAMFLTHAFLHAGLGHLAGNLLALAWLGREAGARWGPRGLGALWLGSVLGGAAVFGLLSRSPAPMVGASGAVFGLAAAWAVALWQDSPPGPRRTAVAAGLIGLALVANVAPWWVESRLVAWQTHLGGFLAGGLVAAFLPRPADPVSRSRRSRSRRRGRCSGSG